MVLLLVRRCSDAGTGAKKRWRGTFVSRKARAATRSAKLAASKGGLRATIMDRRRYPDSSIEEVFDRKTETIEIQVSSTMSIAALVTYVFLAALATTAAR